MNGQWRIYLGQATNFFIRKKTADETLGSLTSMLLTDSNLELVFLSPDNNKEGKPRP